MNTDKSINSFCILRLFALMATVMFLSTSQAAAQDQTTTTAGVPTGDSDEKSAWRVSLFSLGGVDRSQLGNGDGEEASMYFFENYLQLGYKVSQSLRLAARYSFNYSTAGVDKFGKEVTNKADTRDMSLLLSVYDVFSDYLPTSVTYKFQPRLYLPTSDKSQAQGMITSLRLENEVKAYVDRYSYFRLWAHPQYSFQKTTTYLDDRGNARPTDMFLSKHGIDYNHNLSKMFSIVPGFEIEDKWSNASPVNSLEERRENTIDYRLGLEIRALRDLKFTLGYGHKRDLIRTDEFTDGFTLMTNANLF
jgi:hypothetical protein